MQTSRAQLGNERRVFLFSNRQQRHWVSERLSWGSMGGECCGSPFLAGRQLGHMALSSPVTPVDLPSRWSFRGRGKQPQFSCHSCLAITSSTAAQPRGILCLMVFVHIKVRFSQGEMIIASPQPPPPKKKKKKRPSQGHGFDGSVAGPGSANSIFYYTSTQ